ncbi:signal peptidase I [Paenibacillus solanacearum]|uniref:signal peptidase I n=1 Tax=Paenibacillus solanacearum TaxID=2048548 RepID=UPI003CCE96A7
MQANVVLLRAIQDVMMKQGYVDIPSHGASMLPFIRTGDICRFEPIDLSRLKKGDIVLFLDNPGRLVGHRCIGRMQSEKEALIVCKGDSNLYPDEPVPANRVIGRMTSIRKRLIVFSTSVSWMKLWGWLVIRFPLLSRLIHMYLRTSRILRGMKKRLWTS